LIIKWFMRPVIDRYRWTPWFTVAVVAVFAAVFEPLRETVTFGQVNMLLVFLVVADLIVLVYGRSPASPSSAARGWGGVGIGLATAIKLTPGVFILYLLLARKFRAAAVSIATAGGATIAAALVAPHASRIFWTDAVFDTDRVGSLSYISNQSLEGFTARLNPAHPNTVVWGVLVLAALAAWAWQLRRALRLGDDLAGLALTGVLGCLISPVTWVHHLVWLLPALLAAGRRRIRLLIFTLALYVLLSSKLVWPYDNHFTGWGMLFSNAYVLASVVLLGCLPLSGARPAASGGPAAVRKRVEPDVAEPQRAGSARAVAAPDLGKVDEAAAGVPHRVRGRRAVGMEADTRVEPAGGEVRLQHP
jgi:alpha-1,2-mannosyltransferase